jgi:branched-chain amino acid transport system permease protein
MHGAAMLTILFDGTAYGMLLFVLACGLSVTLGLMNFINLAHGAFAMAGGYCTVVLVNWMHLPFVLGLPLAFVVTALLGGLLERTLYVHVYARPHLDQVLFTIGLVFMSVAATDYVMGSSQQFVQIPEALQGQFNLFGVGMGRYRLLIIAICGVLTLALQLILSKTRFGSRLRAAVDDQRVARGLGINVGAVFGLTFAFGSGGGALGAEILGLDPTFPLKYMIYFLIVVTVGGTSSIIGPFLASNIFKSLTEQENLTAVARPGRWTTEKVYALFPRLAERRHNLGHQLSGGEQQMLAVGRALVLNPRVMLLDEPLEGLAPILVDELLAALRRVIRDEGTSAILVEQNAKKILAVTDRAIIPERGAVVHTADSATLVADRAALERHLGVTDHGPRRVQRMAQ